jgi:hypothetical protein
MTSVDRVIVNPQRMVVCAPLLLLPQEWIVLSPFGSGNAHLTCPVLVENRDFLDESWI